MDFREVLGLRRTTRSYQSKQISENQLQQILFAAQTAPLALGDDKTTHLTLVQKPEIMDRIRKCCQIMCKNGEIIDALYGAPTVIFISAKDLSEDHIEFSNVACVIENIILSATNEGLGSSYIWGCLKKIRKDPETLKLLSIPEDYEILSAVVVGYSEQPLAPREHHAKMTINRS